MKLIPWAWILSAIPADHEESEAYFNLTGFLFNECVLYSANLV